MKPKNNLATIVLTTLACLALSDGKVSANGDKPTSTANAQSLTSDQRKMALTVRDFLGVPLIDAKGERLGKIVDLTLKDENGRFDQAVLAVGGVLGIGEVLVSVPYDEIKRTPGTRNLVWDVRQEDFQALIKQARTQLAGRDQGQPASTSHPTGQQTAKSNLGS